MRFATVGLSVWMGLAAPAAGQVVVAVMGDSYSDEYGSFGSGLRNWVEILAANGQVSFGPFAHFPAEDPRGLGPGSFTYNFARGGENTKRLLHGHKEMKAQLPYFVAAVAAGKIQYAILEIGGNDLLGRAVNGQPAPGLFTATTPNEATLAEIDVVVDRIKRILNAATDGAKAPVKMILTTLPDLGSFPYVLWEVKGLTPAHRNNLRLHVQAFNQKIEALAAARDRPVLSLWDWWEDARLRGLTIGGKKIDVLARSPATVDPKKLNHFFLADGLHPTPIAQALIANSFLKVIKTYYGEKTVRLLSDGALLQLSGLEPSDAGSRD